MNAIRDKLYDKLSSLFSDSQAPKEALDRESPTIKCTEDEKSQSSVLAFFLPSASPNWLKQNSPTNEVQSPRSDSFKWRSRSFSLKDKPLDRPMENDDRYGTKEDIWLHEENEKHSSASGHLENGEPGSGTSTSGSSDVFEDFMTPHTFEKPMPGLMEESLFITPDLYRFFEASLPNIVRGCQWVLMYSTVRDGISLQTLFRKSNGATGPCLLITGDKKGAVLGGLIECPLKPTAKRKYQGTNQSFVFTTLYGEPRIFRPTGANRYFYLCLHDSLALGGGANFALFLNEDLLTGRSGPCETFGNLCLAHDEEFELKNVELWGFTHSSQYLH
ncbi:uncharacterized protein LOC127262186 [Andrographis paniculata]|uniref:uncharacterized protein LOC127262186 n=1 Tax=Andrographis paniculata TaxID=175694 RepID=UPI0021E727C8|nr:uncharacterized protein LOC127262186 [Andrographis paniculata]